MTDWKERCAELAGRLDDALTYTVGSDTERSMRLLISRTRAELAQPEPAGVTDRITFIAKAVQECAFGWEPTARMVGNVCAEDVADLCGAVLARWGCPAIAPISASEFLEPEWMRQEDQTRKTTDGAQLIDGEWWAPCSDPFNMQRILDNARAHSRPAIKPVPVSEPGTADHITDDEGHRWDRTMDAALWAKAFCLICPEMASREDVMIGWFANAIMAGCDHQSWKMDAERKPVPVSERLPGPDDCAPWPDEPNATPWAWAAKCVDDGWEWIQLSMLGIDLFTLDSWQYSGGGWTHWLPHYALPVPTRQEDSQ